MAGPSMIKPHVRSQRRQKVKARGTTYVMSPVASLSARRSVLGEQKPKAAQTVSKHKPRLRGTPCPLPAPNGSPKSFCFFSHNPTRRHRTRPRLCHRETDCILFPESSVPDPLEPKSLHPCTRQRCKNHPMSPSHPPSGKLRHLITPFPEIPQPRGPHLTAAGYRYQCSFSMPAWDGAGSASQHPLSFLSQDSPKSKQRLERRATPGIRVKIKL